MPSPGLSSGSGEPNEPEALGEPCGETWAIPVVALMRPLHSRYLSVLLAAAAALGPSWVAAQSAEPEIRALAEWATQGATEAPTEKNRNRVIITTESLAEGAMKALGMNASGGFQARVLVFNSYAEKSGFVFQRAFHVGRYQGETTVIFAYRTLYELDLYRLSPDGAMHSAWHAELSGGHDVISQRDMDQAEAETGLQTELDFWRQQLRDRKALAPRQ